MNNIQKIIEEMEYDLLIADNAISDFTEPESKEYVAMFEMFKAAINKYISKMKLLLNAETQATVKKPEA